MTDAARGEAHERPHSGGTSRGAGRRSPVSGVSNTNGDGTILTFSHRGLRIENAQGFIPGEHAFIDRLEAYLNRVQIPDWEQRYANVAPMYADAFADE